MTIIVATDNMPKKSAYFRASALQQAGERAQTLLTHVPELAAVSFFDRFIQAAQELEPIRRDPCHHHAPVFIFPAARDQAALLQAVEETSDIGVTRNHAARNLAAW